MVSPFPPTTLVRSKSLVRGFEASRRPRIAGRSKDTDSVGRPFTFFAARQHDKLASLPSWLLPCDTMRIASPTADHRTPILEHSNARRGHFNRDAVPSPPTLLYSQVRGSHPSLRGRFVRCCRSEGTNRQRDIAAGKSTMSAGTLLCCALAGRIPSTTRSTRSTARCACPSWRTEEKADAPLLRAQGTRCPEGSWISPTRTQPAREITCRLGQRGIDLHCCLR
jgi:hypothetical protein